MEYRTERDPLGEMQVPAGACYGVLASRAVENCGAARAGKAGGTGKAGKVGRS